MAVRGVDSAYPPNKAQAELAVKDGIKIWGGYFSGPGILNGWSDSEIRTAQSAGLTVICYASGWSNPSSVRDRANQLGIRTALDVEGGIRPDGPWVQSWLDASGSGLYGNCPVHEKRKAHFHQLAAYPGMDPHSTWWKGCPKPAGPVAWQWQGSHTAYGVTVDSAWWDDWFVQKVEKDLTEDQVKTMVDNSFNAFANGVTLKLTGKDRPAADRKELQVGWDTADGILKAVPPGTGPLPEHDHDLAAGKTGGVSA